MTSPSKVISFSTVQSNLTNKNGYGVAGMGIVNALQELGYKVPFQDPAAPVELNFCQPTNWQWSSQDNYKIGLIPWESTTLPAGWVEGMRTANEIWATSPWVKDVFESYGFDNVSVYEHGIDLDIWKNRKRVKKDKIKFLHHGEPAPRKGGQDTLDAFVQAFGNREDVHLTIKAHGYSNIKGPRNNHPDKTYKNVTLIKREYEEHEIVRLYEKHDCLVYPSAGEGFGIIPLQAAASAMPVISTHDWASYSNFLIDDLRVNAKLKPSKWQAMHPGMMYHYDVDQIADNMLKFVDNYNRYTSIAYARSHLVHSKYDWKKLTEEKFKTLDRFF